MSMTPVKGAPFTQSPSGPPRSKSSHTGTTKKGILEKLFKDLSSMFLISTPVGAMKKENVPDVNKPSELFALRGTLKKPTGPPAQKPSNVMAGTPPPKPLKGAPQPPGGNAPSPPAMGGGGVGGPMGGGGAAPGGGAGAGPAAPGGPKVAGALPTAGAPLPGVPAGSRIQCTKDKCDFTTSPSSTIQGIISMTIPVDTANKPILSQIKNVTFIPGNAAATLGVPIKKKRKIVIRTKKDGTKVAYVVKGGKLVKLPGKIITKVQGGKVVQVRQLPNGTTVTVRPTPKPAAAQPLPGPKPAVAPPPPPPNLRRGNRVIIRRADGRAEYINILGIDVFDENGNMIKDNVSASILPAVYANDPGQFGPQFLTDGIHNERIFKRLRLPHTTNDPNAKMIVNLGSDRLISKIVVWNRVNCCSDRIVGCNLVIRNSQNQLVLAHRITKIRQVYVFTFGPKGVIVGEDPAAPPPAAAAPPPPQFVKPVFKGQIGQLPVRTYIRRGPFGRTRTIQVQPDGSRIIYVRDRRGRIIRVIRR